MDALVDVIIPIHDPARPIERAVSSVVSQGTGVARALVVCHNTDPTPITKRVEPLGATVLTCMDGIASPAGPLNAGLEVASSPWVTCMGSDDMYQAGAPSAWQAHLEQYDPDVLLLPVRLGHQDGPLDIPPIRPGRRVNLNVVKDRLLYRTGPLFLVRNSLRRTLDAHMTPNLRTGEDLSYSTRIWTGAGRIDLPDPAGPAYIVCDDADGRISRTPFDLDTLLQPALLLAGQTWVDDLPDAVRHAVAVRVFRRSIAPAAIAHPTGGIQALSTAVKLWTAKDAHLRWALSKAESALLNACLDADTARIDSAAQALTGRARWPKVAPASARGIFEADTRLRHWTSQLLRPPSWRHSTGPRTGEG